MPCLHREDAAKARLELGAPASPARQACGTTWRMTGPRRTILDRRRRPLIDPETVALFRELEAVPMRQRESREFWERAYGLHKRLGLNGEFFCCVQSVLDRNSHPPSPHLFCHQSWFRVRAVRQQLLEASGLRRSA